MTYKIGLSTFSGLAAMIAVKLFGGWSGLYTLLFVCMAVDYLTGFLVAAVFKRSNKSETGALESRAGLKGLIKKSMIIIILIIAHFLDVALSYNVVAYGTAVAFSVNELVSITENMGLMGIKMPKAISKAVELLNRKGDENNEHSDD